MASPVRVNAETSPAGPAGFDDFSHIALDAKYAHLVWGDRRMLPKVNNVPHSFGGLQTYYSRLSFSAVSGGRRAAEHSRVSQGVRDNDEARYGNRHCQRNRAA